MPGNSPLASTTLSKESPEFKNKKKPGAARLPVFFIQSISMTQHLPAIKQYFSKLVSNDEVLANGANLSVSSYVEKEDKREVIDIVKLNEEIQTLQSEIFTLNTEIANKIASL